ncbi:platelet-activating factor acetylhydrolase, isoform II-domain-containing protein [Podospora didyma]|uniref:Putative phospholipase n=1 Tax=Podospora didyma TaxID=330526 RepID=A0AAE0KLL6_9PEZI|nr:platelet-activating factor acetylhydrolase, isoform II-domain-containing protein [Podospora didyma]
MASSLLSYLKLVPSFPQYSGPHKVGTIDVEIPVFALDDPSFVPDGAADIHTVQFRIFYPAVPDSKGKPITWLPNPQRLHVGAYAQFLGVGSFAASILSFLSRNLLYTTIPVHKNAALLLPTVSESGNQRWPTVVFSHGLGGNRNTYSHLVASLASYGVIVVCPEHRDGSAAVTLVRDPNNQKPNTPKIWPYQAIPHAFSNDVWELRNTQLRIRLWELGLGMEALKGIDTKSESIIKSNLNTSTPATALSQFSGKMDVQTPGRVIFAGHSFGAVTIVQLLKTTFYASRPEVAAMSSPLFTPKLGSVIRNQITERNPTILLDMWCFPLLAASTAALYSLPLPIYSDKPSAPGGNALLVIESETFFKWSEHLHIKARILSLDPTVKVVTREVFERLGKPKFSEPHFFYAATSAHLSQSDFGVLFPWLTKKAFGSEQPERILRLNLRAHLQFLRVNGFKVAPTQNTDLVDSAAASEISDDGRLENDSAILSRAENGGLVKTWTWINTIGLGKDAYLSELEMFPPGSSSEHTIPGEDDAEKKMESEIDPSLQSGVRKPIDDVVKAVVNTTS